MVASVYRQAASWTSRRGGNGYMGLSMGSKFHRGDGFNHMLDWVNAESGFSFLRIGLSDTLNRFNETGPNARAKARQTGDAWLAENERFLSRLAIPFELIRWDHWEENDPQRIARNRAHYRDAFENDASFRRAILEDIERFSQRRLGRSADALTAQSFRDYLIEEAAVYEEIYRNYPNTTIYPGAQLKFAEVLRKGTLSETFPHSRFERLRVPKALPRTSLHWPKSPDKFSVAVRDGYLANLPRSSFACVVFAKRHQPRC